jgi:aspartate aminotransferase
MKISQLVTQMAESETLAMSRKSRELAAQGHQIINLSLGEPDFDTPEFIKMAAKVAIDQNYSHYTPVQGYEALLDAIRIKFERDNGLIYSRSQIIASTGAKQSIANLAMAVLDPGDEVVVAAPFWVSYREIIRMTGATPVPVLAGFEQAYKITAEQLAAAITPKTKMFWFSSPCNPTGAAYTKEELESLAEVLQSHPDVLVMSDEIYEHILFEGKHVSMASLPGMEHRTVTVNGLSKSFAMTGWRLGYLGGPEPIIQACIKIQGQTTSATCSITQRAAIAALEAHPQAIQYMRDVFMERRNKGYEQLKKVSGFQVDLPPGAFYFFPEVSACLGKTYDGVHVETADDLCMYFLNKAHVASVPGGAFGAPNAIRLSYATSETLFAQAIARIQSALNS